MLLLIVFALVSRAERRKKIALRLALIAALIMTNPVASGLVFKAWEVDAMPMAEIADPYDYAIVLGGFSRPGRYPDDRIHLSGDPNRLIHAFELYKAGKVRKIVISGGAANVIGEKIGEAPGAKAFLVRAGVPEGDILVESGSRNTRENAANTAALLGGEAKAARCLLVTSAFHMRRAMACFECVGLDCQPFATDHRGGSPGRFSPAYLIPDPSGFSTWQLFVKEWAGMLVYRIIGYC